MLFSRQILNDSQDFFLLNILILIYFFRYENIETHACAFLRLIILAVGTAWLICGTTVSVTIFSNQNFKRAYLTHRKNIQLKNYNIEPVCFLFYWQVKKIFERFCCQYPLLNYLMVLMCFHMCSKTMLWFFATNVTFVNFITMYRSDMMFQIVFITRPVIT